MFKFDKNYNNLNQVRPFYEEFKKIKEKLQKSGNHMYKYNSTYKGRIKGIAGEDEMTAIYLLQHLQTAENREYTIKHLIESGFKEITLKNKAETVKYKEVIQVGTSYSDDDVKKFEGARVHFSDTGRGLKIWILPKGARVKGYPIHDERIFVKN